MGWFDGTPQITGLVVRQRGAALYWSVADKWDERLSETRRWTNIEDMIACGRINRWPAAEMVWLGWQDRPLQTRPVKL